MMFHAHNRETCCCDHCACERALPDTPIEWADTERQGRAPEWIVLDCAVLVLALAILWATFTGSVQ